VSGTSPTILLTGGTGQLGWELRRTLAPLGRVVAPSRAELDLSSPGSLGGVVRSIRPALIVNAGAYTAVDRAEGDADAARRVNADSPGVLAREAADAGALLVHFSTDYVFSGDAERPYRETDPTAPLGVYGRTKLEGEQAVAAAGGPHLVLRTSWVYAGRGHNFLRTMLRLAGERDELRVVDDQHGSPTWARMLAEATASVLGRCRSGEGFAPPEGTGGVYHAAAGGMTTWHGFAVEIMARAGKPVRVAPIATADFPTPARRPRWSVLDCDRLARDFGVRLPGWREQLALCLEEMGIASPAAEEAARG
jgi:dTDP-4-dehydrorhamnose reductase